MIEEQLKVIFKNTKESKDVVRFLNFLVQLQQYILDAPDVTKKFYMKVSKNYVGISPEIRHMNNLTSADSCSIIFTLYPNMYKVSDGATQKGRIFSLDLLSILLFADKSVRPKIRTFSISFKNDQAIIKYQTGNLTSKMVQQCQQFDGEWPTQKGKKVQIFEIGQSAKLISKTSQLILDCCQTGIKLKKVQKGHILQQIILMKSKLVAYDYINFIKEVQMQNKIEVGNKIFTQHFSQCVKLKINCQVSLLISYDFIDETKIRQTYMMLEADTGDLLQQKVFPVKIFKEINPFQIFQTKHEKTVFDPLLKKQDNPQVLRKAVLNNFRGLQNQIRAVGRAQEYINVQFGKIQQGDQTITRKRKFQF